MCPATELIGNKANHEQAPMPRRAM
jgi:hypothetical protein